MFQQKKPFTLDDVWSEVAYLVIGLFYGFLLLIGISIVTGAIAYVGMTAVLGERKDQLASKFRRLQEPPGSRMA